MSILPLLLSLLPPLLGQAHAVPATSWNATCTQKDEPTLWWALTAEKPPDALPAFQCPNVFLDGVDCTTAVGFGQVRQTTDNHLGRAVWQLRYLPYGDWSVINRFLDRTDQGVLFVPKIPPTKPGEVAMPDPDAASLDEAHLFARYLAQREKSSAATSGITLHLWTCPEASFEAPETDLAVQGMTLVRHTARYVLR